MPPELLGRALSPPDRKICRKREVPHPRTERPHAAGDGRRRSLESEIFLSACAARFTFPSAEQFNTVSYVDCSALGHVAIQRKLAAKFPNDFFQHAMILRQRIRIKCGHNASPAQIPDANHRPSDPQTFAWP